MSRNRVLVTGATGFVGAHLVQYLHDAGARLVGALREPERAPPELTEVVRWDLQEGRLPPSLLREVSAVVHLAAYLPSNYLDPEEASRCLELNALGSLTLMRSLVDSEVPTLVNVSSGNVYRDTAEPAREDAAAFPFRHAPYYLASKLVQEIYAEHLALCAGFRLVTLRPSAVYGPAMHGGMVHTFATRLLEGERVQVRDGGRYGVDLVYVGDVVRAAHAALEGNARGCFNIGSGERACTLDVVNILRELTGADGAQIQVERATSTSAPGGGFAPLDIGRAREALGYEPTPLRDGLAAYVSWLRAA